jgi:hypothetical protein
MLETSTWFVWSIKDKHKLREKKIKTKSQNTHRQTGQTYAMIVERRKK